MTTGFVPVTVTFASGVDPQSVERAALNENCVVRCSPLNNPVVVTPVTLAFVGLPLMACSVIVPPEVLWLLHVVEMGDVVVLVV